MKVLFLTNDVHHMSVIFTKAASMQPLLKAK
jgi:hypothetical protein